MVGIEYWGVVEIDRGPTTLLARMTALASAEAAVQGWFVLLLIATAVPWLMWQYRSVRNAQVFGHKVSTGPKAGLIPWFIPFVAWFMPFRIMRELYQGFGHQVGSKSSWLVLFWWAGWVAGTIGTRFVSAADVDTLAEWRSVMLVASGVWLLIAVSGVLAIVMVRRIQRWQTMTNDLPQWLPPMNEFAAYRPNATVPSFEQPLVAPPARAGDGAISQTARTSFCGKCGAERTGGGDTFCRSCGSPLA
jgi:hypothetical protein